MLYTKKGESKGLSPDLLLCLWRRKTAVQEGAWSPHEVMLMFCFRAASHLCSIPSTNSVQSSWNDHENDLFLTSMTTDSDLGRQPLGEQQRNHVSSPSS